MFERQSPLRWSKTVSLPSSVKLFPFKETKSNIDELVFPPSGKALRPLPSSCSFFFINDFLDFGARLWSFVAYKSGEAVLPLAVTSLTGKSFSKVVRKRLHTR